MAPKRQQPFYNSLYDSRHADPDYDSKRGESQGSSQKRRPSSDEDSELSVPPSTSEFLSLTISERISALRTYKRRKLSDNLGSTSSHTAQQFSKAAGHGPQAIGLPAASSVNVGPKVTQSRGTSVFDTPQTQATGRPSVSSVNVAELIRGPRPTQRKSTSAFDAPPTQAIGQPAASSVNVAELRRGLRPTQSRSTSVFNALQTRAIGQPAASSVNIAEMRRGLRPTQSRSTSVFNALQTRAIGQPAASLVSIAELRRGPKATQTMGKSLGQLRGGPQGPSASGAVRPSAPQSAAIPTPGAATSYSDVEVSREEAMRDAFKVDFCEGNALTRWIWEELGKDLEASKPLMLDSFRRTGLPLRKFTFAALRQIVVMLDMVVIPSNIRRKLAEVHAVLESHQHEPLLNVDLKQQLSDIYSDIDTTHTFGVQVLLPKKDDPRVKMATEERKRALVQKAVEVSEKLQSICENIEGYEWSFVNSYSAILKVYSQKYNIRGHELYQRTLDNFSSLAECVGPISQCNALAAIERLATIEATVMALDPHCLDVHTILSIVEQYVDGRLSEVEAVQRSLFSKLIYAIIPFYLFEIDGETIYQFVHGTPQHLGLYTVGREFWFDAISDIRSMMQPLTITNDEIFDILSNYMVGKSRISLPPLPKKAHEVPVHNNAQRASNSPVQPHTKPLPPDPADIEGTGTRVQFSRLSIDEPVAPVDPIERPNSASGFPDGYHTKVSNGTEDWAQIGHSLRGRSKSIGQYDG